MLDSAPVISDITLITDRWGYTALEIAQKAFTHSDSSLNGRDFMMVLSDRLEIEEVNATATDTATI